jgi:hypothetical protein
LGSKATLFTPPLCVSVVHAWGAMRPHTSVPLWFFHQREAPLEVGVSTPSRLRSKTSSTTLNLELLKIHM